ncbi:tRNA 2'-phosphotransferase 1 [Selaginella moellendorffii]|nr:tRNA 2'-phosphotransferase 1 [Selaginella moellendorffii]|eukprot:XP_002979811.2 tRNA 2'-phosphotransferase 1 [Selaginella moellendorffii]
MSLGLGTLVDGNRSYLYLVKHLCMEVPSLSKTIAWVLRHGAVKMDLKIRSNGYCSIKDLLEMDVKIGGGIPLSSFTVADVMSMVACDPKQRFSTIEEEDDQLYIRANQGHTMDAVQTAELLREIKSADEVPMCVHGTFRNNFRGIRKTGLKRMKRNHVHFATGLPQDGVISGMKSKCEVLIYLDLAKAMKDGMKFFMSENGVVLTEGFDGVVPREYFEKIMYITKEE